MSNKQVNSTNLVTGVVRLSYANNLFKARAQGENGEGEKKYGVTLLIPKKDKETIAAFKEARENAIDKGIEKGRFTEKDLTREGFKMALKDGDKLFDDDRIGEEGRGHWVVSCSSKTKPSVINQKGGEDITEDDGIVYSGCYARADINLFPFKNGGNKGISVQINGVLFVKDGDPLAGHASSRSAFKSYISDDEEDEFNDRKPSRKRSRDDDDERPAKKRRRDDDDDEDDRPKKKRSRDDDDDDDDDEDERPRKKKARDYDDDDEEDERPAKKRRRDDD